MADLAPTTARPATARRGRPRRAAPVRRRIGRDALERGQAGLNRRRKFVDIQRVALVRLHRRKVGYPVHRLRVAPSLQPSGAPPRRRGSQLQHHPGGRRGRRVQACRTAVLEQQRAVERGDSRVTDLAAPRNRSIMPYLRERDRTDLIHQFAVEWPPRDATPPSTSPSAPSLTFCSAPSPTGHPHRRHPSARQHRGLRTRCRETNVHLLRVSGASHSAPACRRPGSRPQQDRRTRAGRSESSG